MNARQKFLRWVEMAPEKTQRGFAYDWFFNPTSISYWYIEVKAKTKLGKQFLKDMGWED